MEYRTDRRTRPFRGFEVVMRRRMKTSEIINDLLKKILLIKLGEDYSWIWLSL